MNMITATYDAAAEGFTFTVRGLEGQGAEFCEQYYGAHAQKLALEMLVDLEKGISWQSALHTAVHRAYQARNEMRG